MAGWGTPYRATTLSSGAAAVPLTAAQQVSTSSGSAPTAGGGLYIPSIGGGTHIQGAPQLPLTNSAAGGTVLPIVNAGGEPRVIISTYNKKMTEITGKMTVAAAIVLKRELKAHLAANSIPPNMHTFIDEQTREQIFLRQACTTQQLPGQPKSYVLDPLAIQADPDAWCRWNTLPLLELFINNHSRAYELDEHSIQFRSVNLLTRSLVKILCRVTLNLNTMDHEDISNKGLAIVRRYELDTNADSLSLPEAHILLRTMTAALQQNVDENNNIITNAHGTTQSRNLIALVVTALNSHDWDSCPRSLLFRTWFLILCRTLNEQIDQQRLISSQDIGSVKMTQALTGFPDEEKVVPSGGKRVR